MTQKIIITVIALLVIGFGAFSVMQSFPPSSTISPETVMPNSPASSEKTDETLPDTGTYADYTESTYNQAVASRRVLFFFASWCPTCRPADADFQANLSKIPTDVTIFKVHYNDPETTDEHRSPAAKYSVTYQHTFVQVDETGTEVTRWNGGGIDILNSNIK